LFVVGLAADMNDELILRDDIHLAPLREMCFLA